MLPLLKDWQFKLKSNIPISPIRNKYLSPISIITVVNCIKILIDKKNIGVFHLSASDQISYMQLGKILINLIAVDQKLLSNDNRMLNQQYFSTLMTSKIFKKISNINSDAVIINLIKQNFNL
ncbi:hypothetical protein OAZ15_04770 [Pelagibacteraceae bacterium]|nr:hypothetical protein [Pelagibacteraceae bacterium]